jgi:hypothetical protein
MLSSTRKAATVMLISVSLAGVATSAVAETQWEQTHPRREQVNDRLANQSKRIKTEVAQGEMSKGQAAKLHKADHQIRGEERAMASQNNGHISKQEQRTLNRQENAVSRKIGN